LATERKKRARTIVDWTIDEALAPDKKPGELTFYIRANYCNLLDRRIHDAIVAAEVRGELLRAHSTPAPQFSFEQQEKTFTSARYEDIRPVLSLDDANQIKAEQDGYLAEARFVWTSEHEVMTVLDMYTRFPEIATRDRLRELLQRATALLNFEVDMKQVWTTR
jgi:hypothetical protein